jgi:dihydrofolate reductase
MGRKTFDSIGKPLPNRTTIVLSRAGTPIPGALTISDLDQLKTLGLGERQIFICGGAEIYRQTLPLCSDLYLTLVKRTVEGDTFFPPFEDRFQLVAELQDSAEFKILHYQQPVSPGDKR